MPDVHRYQQNARWQGEPVFCIQMFNFNIDLCGGEKHWILME